MSRKFNWPLWTGFLLTIIAFMSYFSFFVRFPVTRDFPWVNLILFALAAVLLVAGVRRGFTKDQKRPTLSRIIASAVATLGVLMLAFFIFTTFILARRLPPSREAPHVGQKAPEFTLPDASATQVSLSQLLTTPLSDGKQPRGVLLIFYRGYW